MEGGHDFACLFYWFREVAGREGKCMSCPQAAEYNMVTNKQNAASAGKKQKEVVAFQLIHAKSTSARRLV
jgi:hypothetical protein